MVRGAKHGGRVLTRAAVLVVALFLAFVPNAGAQDDDPYGGTTTTTAPPSGLFPTCHFELEASTPGTSATLTVMNVPFGATVRVLVGGIEAGRATAPLQGQSVGSPVLFGGQALPAQAARTTLEIPFEVPDLPPGFYAVTAVGVDFTLTCDQDRIEVLGDQAGGGGSLPRTGIYAGVLVLVAIALLLIGRAFQKAAQERKRQAERQARREARRAAREAETVDSTTK